MDATGFNDSRGTFPSGGIQSSGGMMPMTTTPTPVQPSQPMPSEPLPIPASPVVQTGRLCLAPRASVRKNRTIFFLEIQLDF